jgi:hypothetical protein
MHTHLLLDCTRQEKPPGVWGTPHPDSKTPQRLSNAAGICHFGATVSITAGAEML